MNIFVYVEIKSLIINADIYFSKNYFESLPNTQHSSSVSHERFPWRHLMRYDFDTHKIRFLCRHTVQKAPLKKCHKPPPNLPQHFHKDGLELPILCRDSIGNIFPKTGRKC